jgi:hypothetical protein
MQLAECRAERITQMDTTVRGSQAIQADGTMFGHFIQDAHGHQT